MKQSKKTHKTDSFRKKILIAVFVAAAVTLVLFCTVSASANLTPDRTIPFTGGRGRIAIYASGGGILAGCTIYGITALRMKKRRREDEEDDDDSADDND